jgi:predicted permease
MMIRTALGASRARLIQQLLTESFVLSAIAALLGLLVAVWTTTVAAAAQPAQLSSQTYSILDWRVLVFTIGAALVAATLFSVGPVFYTSRIELGLPTRTATAGPRQARMRLTLVAIQIAVTIVLLTGSIALGRAFLGLLQVDNGYEVKALTTLSVSFAGTPYTNAAQKQQYYTDVVARLRNVPGVVAVTGTESLPLNVDSFMGGRFTVDGAGPESSIATVTLVAPEFFSTIGGRVLFGREFTSQDLKGVEQAAVVSEELARQIGDPAALVGHLLTAARGTPRRIIGVVRGVRYGGPTSAPYPQVFYITRSPGTLTFIARLADRARDLTPVVRDTVQSVDPKVPVFNVKSMEERLDATLARPKFYATAVTFFGGLALLLALIGVYGMVSYGIMQRTRELGIRLALGTTPARLRSWLLRRMWVPVGLGVVPGVAVVIVVKQAMGALIVGADSALAGIAALGVVVTTGVATVAIWTATGRISHLDVLDVIRADSGE